MTTRKPKPISKMTLCEMIYEIGKCFRSIPVFDGKDYACNTVCTQQYPDCFDTKSLLRAVSKALGAVRKERAKK